MYEFIFNQLLLGRINAEKVQSYTPRWITADQAATILNAATTPIDQK